jgi:hypothetical protein
VPIRWSALKVSEAADKIEKLVNQAAPPLEQARVVAREALNLPNLPQYIEQDFNRIIGEIDRTIGGTRWEPIGRIRAGVESTRKDIPDGAIENERNDAKHGTTNSLV